MPRRYAAEPPPIFPLRRVRSNYGRDREAQTQFMVHFTSIRDRLEFAADDHGVGDVRKNRPDGDNYGFGFFK